MRRSSFASFSSVLFGMFIVSGCSAFGGDSEEPPAPEAADMPARGPEPTPVTGAPAENEITEKFGVFVSPQGVDTADGAHDRPMKTLDAAIRKAKETGRRVYACADTYREPLVIANGVPIIGGLECNGWTWTISASAKAIIESPTSPAIIARDITAETRLDGLEVVAADATTARVSSVALLAVRSPGLIVSHSRLRAGRGADGMDGAAPIQLSRSSSPDGATGEEERSCYVAGSDSACPTKSRIAAGGTGTCSGAPGHDGGNGGEGGSGGTFRIENRVYTEVLYAGAVTGMLRRDFRTDGTSAGGAGGTQVVAGANGSNGEVGKDGSSGTLGTLNEDGYVAANGVAGTDGAPGTGGGGGGGQLPDVPNLGSYKYRGQGGGGGGAGGCPGLAGGAGGGGGASIAIVALESAFAIEDSELIASFGGNGGKGNVPSKPVVGGRPGNIGDGAAAGGYGGSGGRGGVSGHGAGGPSLGIAFAGVSPKSIRTTTTTAGGGRGVPAVGDELKTVPASADGATAAIMEF